MFLDTLQELFEGKHSLFTGLAAESRWDWTKKYPVIRIIFGGGVLGSMNDLNQSLHQQLTTLEQQFGVNAQFPDHRSRFKDLIAPCPPAGRPAHGGAGGRIRQTHTRPY